MSLGSENGWNSKGAEISVCLFPHLRQFIVVDARPGLPNRPRFDIVDVDEVFDEGFFDDLQDEFSDLVHKEEKPFLKLLSLPQDLEGLIRLHGMRAILTWLNADVGEPEGETAPNMAVLFMTGPFLTLGESGLQEALRDMFSVHLRGGDLEGCVQAVTSLARQEKRAGAGEQTELSSLIRGDDSRYATLWQNLTSE